MRLPEQGRERRVVRRGLQGVESSSVRRPCRHEPGPQRFRPNTAPVLVHAGMLPS